MAEPTSSTSRKRLAASVWQQVATVGSRSLRWARGASSNYLSRRPHRSFRRTRRRDYVRSLNIPGYWAFSSYVFRTLWSHKILFAGLVAFYAALGAIFVGLSSQDAYAQLSDLLTETGGGLFSGGWGAIGQAGLLLASGLAGGVSPQLTDVQQVYAALILLLTWLTTVWLLRAILAGRTPRLRDGIYNAGAPIVVTAIILMVLVVQLLPATVGLILLTSAFTTELFQSGLIAMVVTLVVILLVILSLYWAVSTVMALIISTLPGMYPWQALRTAGDVVIGRRLRILLRILWVMTGNVVVLVVTLLPVILFDRWVKGALSFMQVVPIVPIAMALVSSLIVIWSAAYMYLLYRKVVEDDASPA